MRTFIAALILSTFFIHSTPSIAGGQNEKLDSVHYGFLMLEKFWEQDNAQYTHEALKIARLLDSYQFAWAQNWEILTQDRKLKLVHINFKLAEFLTHQKDPRVKRHGRMLPKSNISLPELSIENLQRAERLFGRYLELAERVFRVIDLANPLAVKAYYFRATTRMIVAEYHLERVYELGGKTKKEQTAYLRGILAQLAYSALELKRALIINQHFNLPLTIAEDLEIAHALSVQARETLIQISSHQH